MFIILGLSAALPFSYIGFTKSNSDHSQYYLPEATLTPWLIGGGVYIAGTLMYVNRIPEKYIPYRFDIWFSSHQIFHIAVLIGCVIHFVESLNLYNEKKEFTCPMRLPPVV